MVPEHSHLTLTSMDMGGGDHSPPLPSSLGYVSHYTRRNLGFMGVTKSSEHEVT